MPKLQIYLLLSIIILFISWIGYIFLNKLIELFKMREGFFLEDNPKFFPPPEEPQDPSGNPFLSPSKPPVIVAGPFPIDPSGNKAPNQRDPSGNMVKPYQQESYIKSTKVFGDNIYHVDECNIRNAKKLFELKKRNVDINYISYDPHLYDLNGYPIKDINSCFIKTKKGAKIFNKMKCQVEPSTNMCGISYK